MARRRKEVSEKSLELNLCAELLQYIRSWPGCDRALWFGLTQALERQEGIDARIKNAGPGVSVLLQFKAPWVTSLEDRLYKFSVNEQQHEAMEDLVGNKGNEVYYVFPLFSTWSKAERHAPDLASDTWMVPVSSIPLAKLTALSSPSTGLHRVDVQRANSFVTVTFHSPEVTADAINARQLFSQGGMRHPTSSDNVDPGPFGVSSDELLTWVERWSHLRFRGLNAIFVPTRR